jgi:hypothetical protein
MAALSSNSNESGGVQHAPGKPRGELADPRAAFRSALCAYQASRLAALMQRRGLESQSSRSAALADELTEQLDSPAAVARLLADLDGPARQVLALFGMTETTMWPVVGLRHTLSTLAVEPTPVISELLDRGLLAVDTPLDPHPIDGFAGWSQEVSSNSAQLRVHPSVPQGVRAVQPAGKLRPCDAPVVQVRESDGLEPVLRLGALWQRVGVEPLRQTQHGALYKRDAERLHLDPVLAEGVSDALVPVPGLSHLWLDLARRVGLIRLDAATERLEAAPAAFWSENVVHLPQMIATAWLGLREGWSCDPDVSRSPESGSLWMYLRPAVLLWLATLEQEEWTALDDLAENLFNVNPDWDRATPRRDSETGESAPRRSGSGRRRNDPQSSSSRGARGLGVMLLGAGYALGLVRTGEESKTRRTVVQLTPLGRYVLTLGPPPPPRPSFEHFLFVQPNLEIIAYRQGVTPQLAGILSRFAWWSKIGAALEMKLTQESITLGLDAGLTPPQMIETLARHSQRALPTVVHDAIARWTTRRERITFYAAATLIEFGSQEERDQALESWSENEEGSFVPVAERFLLAETAQRIPTDRVRTRGSRDYRHPPERCVSIEADGITLSLDTTRSDLLIDAELARIADQVLPSRADPHVTGSDSTIRQYLVTPASIGRALDLGITAAQIVDWFLRRTGAAPSPAISLLLSAAVAPTVLAARRQLVLTVPSPEVADGLLQHPATRELMGQRVGPTALIVPEDHTAEIGQVLAELGLRFRLE